MKFGTSSVVLPLRGLTPMGSPLCQMHSRGDVAATTACRSFARMRRTRQQEPLVPSDRNSTEDAGADDTLTVVQRVLAVGEH